MQKDVYIKKKKKAKPQGLLVKK